MKVGAIHDLNEDRRPHPIVTDVCILGAGPVGLTLAAALAKHGLRVVVLEIGGKHAAVKNDSNVQFDRRPYRGATLGRAFGLGGTSSLWGGQLLPLRDDDFLARPQIGAPAWPFSADKLTPYFHELQSLLGLKDSRFDLAALPAAHLLGSMDFSEWSPRLSKWLAFNRRNVALSLRRQLKRSSVDIWLHAQVLGWESTKTARERRIHELVAKSPNGNNLRVQPQFVVLASGALESALLVLALEEQVGPLGAGVAEHAGRHLHDHLSLRIAHLRVKDAAAFQTRFAPFFEGGTMRSLRMELPSQTLEFAGLPGLYMHFIADTPAGSGFAVVRDGLRALQKRDFAMGLRALTGLPRALPDLAKIAYVRSAQSRLAFPAGTEFYVHVDLEQAARMENRIYLANLPNTPDKQPRIRWDVDENAGDIADLLRPLIDRFWQRNTLDRIASVDFLDLRADSQAWNHNVYDLYHPAGTTRMSSTESDGVVDPDLKIFGTSNVFVAGSSVFPSMGAANPTFTAMLLGLRAARFIAQKQLD